MKRGRGQLSAARTNATRTGVICLAVSPSFARERLIGMRNAAELCSLRAVQRWLWILPQALRSRRQLPGSPQRYRVPDFRPCRQRAASMPAAAHCGSFLTHLAASDAVCCESAAPARRRMCENGQRTAQRGQQLGAERRALSSSVFDGSLSGDCVPRHRRKVWVSERSRDRVETAACRPLLLPLVPLPCAACLPPSQRRSLRARPPPSSSAAAAAPPPRPSRPISSPSGCSPSLPSPPSSVPPASSSTPVRPASRCRRLAPPSLRPPAASGGAREKSPPPAKIQMRAIATAEPAQKRSARCDHLTAAVMSSRRFRGGGCVVEALQDIFGGWPDAKRHC